MKTIQVSDIINYKGIYKWCHESYHESYPIHMKEFLLNMDTYTKNPENWGLYLYTVTARPLN